MSTDLIPTSETGLVALSPKDVVAVATEQANALMDMVKARGLMKKIQGKDYLVCEGWEVIGAFNGIGATTEKLEPLYENDQKVGYEATVGLYKSGIRIGGATMSCGFDEFPCKGKSGMARDKAAKSAAQTWAESKAYRMNFSWVAVLAGFEPTPAEEMIQGEYSEVVDTPKPPQAQPKRQPKKDNGHDYSALWKLARQKGIKEPAHLHEALGVKTLADITPEAAIAQLNELPDDAQIGMVV